MHNLVLMYTLSNVTETLTGSNLFLPISSYYFYFYFLIFVSKLTSRINHTETNNTRKLEQIKENMIL